MNSNTNRWLSVITLLLVTANIVTLVLLWTNKKGGHGPENPPPPAGQAFEFITHELNLDSTQQVAYRKMREDHQAAVRPLQDSIRSSKDAMFNLLKLASVTDTQVDAYNNKIGALEQQLNLVTFHHFQKLRQLCNADQQKKFDNIIADVLRRMAPVKRQGPPPPAQGPGRPGDGPGLPGEGPERGNMPPPPGPDDQIPPKH